jgi:hypothetical protein
MKKAVAHRTAALALIALAVPHLAFSGYLVTTGTIQSISNTSGNNALFTITVVGGSGPCNGQNIAFLAWAAPDADTHKRAYALAMLAFATGKRINVYNYTNDACTTASYIDVVAD